MTNSTETFWSIDGVSLQTYAFNISTWGGDAQSPPPMRGSDTTIPYAVGDTYHRKVPGARTVSFGMWVIGANEDGSMPAEGSSRRKFEENWRALRKLMWNPNRQVTLTKRFYDWTSGEIVEASAKAEFAGGLAPTMNGSQRAVFTVQFKLADPFFYGEEHTISINAMQEAARNYAINPKPMQSAIGYSAIRPTGLVPKEIHDGTVEIIDGENAVEVFYINQPTTKEGGIAFGGNSSEALAVVPGQTRRYTARFRSILGGVYQSRVRFLDAAHETVSVQTLTSTLTVPASTWFNLPTVALTTPAGAEFAAMEVVEHPTSGRIPKSCAINRAPNPDFSAVGGYQQTIRNLFFNPSFELEGSTDVIGYTNTFENSAFEASSSAQKIIYNLIHNPKFGNGPRGWHVRSAGMRPGNTLKVLPGGPVGGSYMQFNTPELVNDPTVTTSYTGSSRSGESGDRYGTADGVTGSAVGTYYGSAWVRSPNGTQNVDIRLVERYIGGAVIKTTSARKSVGTAWTRIELKADKLNSGGVSRLHLEFTIPGTGEKRLFLAGAMLTNSNAFAGYFDGDGYLQVASGRSDSSSVPEPIGLRWNGTRNSSYSVMDLRVPYGLSVPAGRQGYTTNARRVIAGVTYTDRAYYLVRSDRADEDVTPLTYGIHLYMTTEADVGKTLTVVAEAEVPNGYSGAGDPALNTVNPARAIYVEGFGSTYPERAQAPATPGVHVVRIKLAVTEPGQLIRLSGGGTPAVSMGWKKPTIVRGDYDGPPFTGSLKGASTTPGPWDVCTPAWTGGSPWTTSVLKAKSPKHVTPYSNTVVVSGTARKTEGSRGLEISRGPDTSAAAAATGARIEYLLTAGKTYTITVNGIIPNGYDASEDNVLIGARGIYAEIGGGPVNGGSNQVLATLPSTPGTYTLKTTISPTASAVLHLGGGGLVNQSVYWDKLTIVEGSVDIEPFTGSSTGGTDSIEYRWAGTTNDSESIKLMASPVGLVSPTNDSYGVDLGAGVRGATIINTTKDPQTNYVTFANTPDIFGYGFGYNAYTVMLRVVPSELDVGAVESDARTVQLTLADGTVLKSPQFDITGATDIRWTFDRPASEPVELKLNIGHNSGSVTISKFAVVPVKYDGPYFSGNSEGAYWWGAPNASESQLRGDRYYLSTVFVTADTYTGPYFDGNTPDTGSGDSTKTYAWVGAPYASESTYSTVNLNGVDIDVAGDYYTRKIKVVATPPVASYSIVSKTGDIEPQGYAYTLGVKSRVTVDVENFTVEVVGSPGDKAYAVEPTRQGYWLELAPGVNTLLLRGVGTGKLDVRYRAAWI